MRHRGIVTHPCLVIAEIIYEMRKKHRLYATVTAVPDAVTINMPLFSPSTS